MTFDYNGHLTFEERVALITKELIEYGIDKDTALKIASIEEPITTNNIEDARYKRYSNILKINKNKDIEDKVIKDIYKYYKKGNKKIDKYIDDLSIYVEYNTDLPEYK